MNAAAGALSHGRLRTVAEILGAHSPQEKWGVKAPVDYGTTGERALEALVTRAAKPDPKTGIYKLDGVMVRGAQELAHVGLVPECPKDRIIVRFVVVSGEPARDRKLLEVPGVNWRAWDANPVTMFCHNYEEPPVGRGLWRGVYKRGEVYEVWKDIEFMPHDLYPFANIVGRMYADGWMRGISGGWKGEEMRTLVNRAGKPVAVHFLKSDWLEDSACPIPIDKYALSEAVQRGVMSTDARDIFAQHARWPELSKGVAYEITPEEVLHVANRSSRADRARITRAIPSSEKRTLIEDKKLNPDNVALLKPDARRAEGDDDETTCAECGEDLVAGVEHVCPEAAAGDEGTQGGEGEGAGAAEGAAEGSAAAEGAAAGGGDAAAAGAADAGGAQGEGDGSKSDPAGGGGAPPVQRSVRPETGAVLADGVRGELARGLGVGFAKLKAGVFILMEPVQELSYVVDNAYYQKRAVGAGDDVPFLAPVLEAWGFQRGNATRHVVAEHAVHFAPERFADHRACRSWLAENGLDDNTQIATMKADGKRSLFSSVQHTADDFIDGSLQNVEIAEGVVVTRGTLKPEAAERFIAERRAVDPEDPWGVEMRGDRYLTLIENALEMIQSAVQEMRDALDADAAAAGTADEVVIGQSALTALEENGLGDIAAELRAGRVLSTANRQRLAAAQAALADVLAIEEKPGKKKAAAADEGAEGTDETRAVTAHDFDDVRSRLGAVTASIDESTRADGAQLDAEVRGMMGRFATAAERLAGTGDQRTTGSREAGRAAAAPAPAEQPTARRAVSSSGLPHVRLPAGPSPMVADMARRVEAATGLKLDIGSGTE